MKWIEENVMNARVSTLEKLINMQQKQINTLQREIDYVSERIEDGEIKELENV